MIRIIAGKYKGRQIVGIPRDRAIRPISARMRQSLFDILRPWLPGSRFLDLYAGSGAVGLEALSRGAEWVVFAERDPRCLRGIERNLQRLEAQPGAKAMRLDAVTGLGRLKGQSFDIIFAGPPYRDLENRPTRLARVTLEAVARSDLLAPGGLVVLQRHRTEGVDAPAGLRLWREERYGDTRIGFYRSAVTPSAGEESGFSPGELEAAREGEKLSGTL